MILFVDDSPMNQKLIKMMLEMYKYEVFVASAGKEAEELFKKNHTKIKLLIIDYNLPDTNGIELYRKLKEIDENVLALAFTGTVDEEEKKNILSSGFSDIIPKPVTVEVLLNTVKKYYLRTD